MKQQTFTITGMHCTSCAITVEQTLQKTKGILLASVNYASEKISVEYDEKIIDDTGIKRIVHDLGYSMTKEQMLHAHHSMTQHQKINFLFTLVFGVPLIYIVMGEMIGFPTIPISLSVSIIIQTILSSVIILFNLHIYIPGIKNLIKRTPTMDSLIALGTLSAYLYSLIAGILYVIKPIPYFMPKLYFESAAFILIFISLGKYLETLTKSKTSDAIKKLINLQPQEATVIRNGKQEKIAVIELKPNDFIIVKPGEKIASDGIVFEGNSTVNEQMITGESMPVEKEKGEAVIGGTLNEYGVLKIKVTKTGDKTLLSQIIKTVETAMNSKTHIQLLVDKVSFYFVPIITCIAVVSFCTWLVLGFPLSFAINILVSVLIIACPCALGLATPTAIMVGVGMAAQQGILIKTGKALEIAEKIKTVVFDKTGTLTKGKPSVTDVVSFDTHYDIIQLAYSLEKNSEHPLAHAVVMYAEKQQTKPINIRSFNAVPGKGITGIINNQISIIIGTRKLLKEHNVLITESQDRKATDFEHEGKTLLFVAQDNVLVGFLAIADTIKENAFEAIEEIRKHNIKVYMISGDNKRVNTAVARKLHIDHVIAEVLPNEKSDEIKKLQHEHNIVAMVGDGINDAPALAQADLGIAISTGSDIAIEAGDIVLVGGNIHDVMKAITISTFTIKKIKQNLFWAFFYNITMVPVAAGLLYYSKGILLNPAIAAFAMTFSSLSVVLNALFMKRTKI